MGEEDEVIIGVGVALREKPRSWKAIVNYHTDSVHGSANGRTNE